MARPRADDYEAKRQLIRERAAELFAEHGFARTSITDIARACQCTKSLIYHYFDSKQAILYDLLAAHMDGLSRTVQDAIRGPGSSRDIFREVVRAHMRMYATARAKHVLLLNELDSLPPRSRAAIVAKERELVAIVLPLIVAIAPALGRRPDVRMPAAMAFYGLINWTYTWYRPDGAMSPQGFADLASDILLDGLSAALSRNPA